MAYRIKTVIVDLLGTTLGKFSKAPAVALTNVFKMRGVELSSTEVRQYMGLPKSDHISKTLSLPAVKAKWKEANGREPNLDADSKELYSLFEIDHTTYLTNPEFIAPIPGALEALTQFREMGMKIGVTTGFNTKEVTTILDAFRSPKLGAIKLDSYFDHIVPCDHPSIRRGRPHPDGIWANMIALGCNFPKECLKIGDTVVDVLEGRAAGVPTAIVTKYSSLMGEHTEDIEELEKNKPKEYHYYMREVFNKLSPHSPTFVWETLPQGVQYLTRR